MKYNIDELFEKQFEISDHFKKVFNDINNVETRRIEFDNFYYILQFNPCRISSATADTKKKISSEDCFLCEGHRFKNQIGIQYNENYELFVNPFPIFKKHLTIVDKHHVSQEILGQEEIMLEMAQNLPDFTVFYNSRFSGASAPFHRHFQACPTRELPIFCQWNFFLGDDKKTVSLVLDSKECFCVLKYDSTRYFYLIEAFSLNSAAECLKKILTDLQTLRNSLSPEANIGVCFENNTFKIVVFPRSKHRPEEYFEKGENHLTISPGFADMAGIIPCAIKSDFLKLNKDLISKIFNQVTLEC